MRSLAIQGSWNYRTMQGAGLAFALLPFLHRCHSEDGERLAESVGRHAGFFNAHPYLATVALGAIARLESGDAQPEMMDRFKTALVSPLGALGDRLVWARWRPLCSLLALLLFLAGVPWWVAGAAFLILYNAAHLSLRIWGLALGWREGHQVGRALLGSPLRRIADRLTIPLAAISGALLPPLALALAEDSGVGPLSTIGLGLALAAVGSWRPAIVGRLAAAGLVVASVYFAVLGTT